MVRREEDDGREHERGHDRADGNGDRQPTWLVETSLDADHGSLSPPAISSPNSSTVADSAARSPTTAPSYITTTRSASARISSRSSLISSTPTPCSAAPRK